jgi:hypothetical protein
MPNVRDIPAEPVLEFMGQVMSFPYTNIAVYLGVQIDMVFGARLSNKALFGSQYTIDI